MADKIVWSENGTPGPWRILTYNNGHLLGYLRGSPVGKEHYGDVVVQKFAKPTSAISKANARAIAEVPVMVVTLRDYDESMSREFGDGPATVAFSEDRFRWLNIRAILQRIDAETPHG